MLAVERERVLKKKKRERMRALEPSKKKKKLRESAGEKERE